MEKNKHSYLTAKVKAEVVLSDIKQKKAPWCSDKLHEDMEKARVKLMTEMEAKPFATFVVLHEVSEVKKTLR